MPFFLIYVSSVCLESRILQKNLICCKSGNFSSFDMLLSLSKKLFQKKVRSCFFEHACLPKRPSPIQFHHIQPLPIVKGLLWPKSSVSSVTYAVVAITDLKFPEAYLVLSILFRGGLPDAEILLDRLQLGLQLRPHLSFKDAA